MRLCQSPRRQRGFTLIEVVVAFAVFALCIGAIYESFSGSMRRSAQSREHSAELLTAQSLLAVLRTQPGPWESPQEGKSPEGRSWRIEVSPYDAGTDPRNPWRAYAVTVQVGTAGARPPRAVLRSVELASVRP